MVEKLYQYLVAFFVFHFFTFWLQQEKMKVIKSLVYFKPCSACGENDCHTILGIISHGQTEAESKEKHGVWDPMP